MYFTWIELDTLANDIRNIRDEYIQVIPIDVFIILYRNLKIIEQELRILQEIDNFIKKSYSSADYLIQHQKLENTPIFVNLRKIPLAAFNNEQMSLNILARIAELLKEE